MTVTREVFILDAVRTPIGRYAGALAEVRPDDLAAGVLRALLDRSEVLDPAEICLLYTSLLIATAPRSIAPTKASYHTSGILVKKNP